MKMTDDEEDWENYESGPYCLHWSEPWDCEEVCAGCGHRCTEHDCGIGRCMEDGCTCEKQEEDD